MVYLVTEGARDWLARVIRANPFYVTCHVSALNVARGAALVMAIQDF
jgi:hypothetical protein